MRAAIIDHTESIDGRVELIRRLLNKKGIKVDIITSDFSHYTKQTITKQKDHYIYLHTIPYKKNLSVKRILSHMYFARNVYNYLQRNHYDLVWLLLPPNILLKKVTEAKKKRKFKLIADIEDLWPESLPVSKKIKSAFPFRIWKNLRDHHLKYSDYVVTECEGYKRYVRNYLGQNQISTLYLAKSGTATKIRYKSPQRPEIRVAYLGSINNIIDINEICRAINIISKHYCVTLEIIGDGESRVKLINSLSKMQNVQINFHGKIFDEKKKDIILRKCNFGINMMQQDVVVGFTMKSLDYLKNGLFLLNNIQNDTWNFVQQNEIGVNIRRGNDNIDFNIIKKSFDNAEKNKVIDFYNSYFSEKAFDNKASKIIDKVLM